jgi:4-amino-4-deoxy-L-arabinose transferase-like glycosyltransferase
VPTLDATEISSKRFALSLGALAVIGCALRLWYLAANRDRPISGDAVYYRSVADSLADGGDVLNPLSLAPTALHPPGWSIILAVPDRLGVESIFHQQVFAVLIGTLTVVLVGLAASEIAGRSTGLIASGIAVLYPNLWLHERTLLSEVALLPFVAVAIIVAYRHMRTPRLALILLLGATIGFLALIRSEQLLLLPCLLVPTSLLAGRTTSPVGRRVIWCCAGSAAALAVLLPWVLYNNSRFEEQVLLSTNFGAAIRIANCPQAYEGDYLGYLQDSCWDEAFLLTGDESQVEVQLRERGLTFVRENVDRLPAVAAARLGRTWNVYRPFQQARLDAQFSLSDVWWSQVGVVAYWALLPCAIGGFVVLRGRRIPTFILLSFGVVVMIATLVTLGQIRMRAAAEVPLVILAAVGVNHLARRPPTRQREASERLDSPA